MSVRSCDTSILVLARSLDIILLSTDAVDILLHRMNTDTPIAAIRPTAITTAITGLLPNPVPLVGRSDIFMVYRKAMNREHIPVIRNGRVRYITPDITTGQEEIEYMIEHGEKNTYITHGMRYPIENGYSPDIKKSNTISQIIHDPRYRDALISYIARYVTSSESSIYRSIPTGAFDMDIARNLSKLPKIRSSGNRIQGRKHMVANILSKVAHVKIDKYLDYGTGRGDVAHGIGQMLNADVTGVEVYHDPKRAIDTKIISQGELLPEEWEGRFHLITAFSVLHHVQEQRDTVRELCRVLAPGGILILREHDYRDNAFIWDNGPKILSPENRPFRVFLDAIHVSAMAVSSTGSIEPDFWSLYRGKNEWDAMVLSNPDMVSTYTSYPDNPQRLYTQVYMKYTQNIPLILEQRIRRSDRIRDFFPRPREGPILGPMPKVMEGINYNEEILAYMTPWRIAQDTSKAIAERMKNRYDKFKTYRLVDGTGGAGGNVIAFSQNKALSHISAYEMVPEFYTFMANNVGLYVPSAPRVRDKTISYKNDKMFINLYNSEFSIGKSDLRNTVLFLDVPWEHEGTGYRLEGYSYSGMPIEDAVKMAFEKKSLMVVLKLPPGYRLGIRSERQEMGKEDLHFIYPWLIKKREEVSIPGGDLAMEVLRYRMMLQLRDEFRRIFSDMNPNDYYRWLLDRLRYGTLDPVIPATEEYLPSVFLSVYQVEVPHNYAALYKMSMSMGIPRREIPPARDKDGVESLRQRIREEKSSTLDDSKMIEMDNVTRNIYKKFKNTSPSKIKIDSKNEDGMLIITISDIEIKITKKKEASLRRRYKGNNFMRDMSAMLLRYMMIMEDVAGVNMHAAIPEPVFNILRDSTLRVNMEGFASPLNATLDCYHSMFPDVDRVFGSLGSFFSSSSISGSWELNPPFIEDIMIAMTHKIQHMMEEADKIGDALSMVVIVPNWASSEAIDMLTKSSYLKKMFQLTGDEHRYVTGSHHLGANTVSFFITTNVYILQSDIGQRRFLIPIDIESTLRLAFR